MLTSSIEVLGGLIVALVLVALLVRRLGSQSALATYREEMPGQEQDKTLKEASASPRLTGRFIALTEMSDLERALERSEDNPVWIFQHDPFCPISRAAWTEVARYDGNIDLVDVAGRHALVRAIEARTGVRHESPQVLLLRHRQAVWSASHFAITAAAMTKAASRADAT